VPGQHHHGDAKDDRIEQLLAHALEQLRQCAGKRRDQACGHHSRQHAAADPSEAMGHGACNRQHNADDQAGFKHFAKDDDERGEHLDGVLLHVQRTARLLVEVVVELVAAGLQRPHIDHALAFRGDDFFHPQRFAFKLHRLGIEILNPEYHWLVGGRAHLARLKRTVRIAQPNFRGLLRERRRRMKKRGRANGGSGGSASA